MLRILVIWWLRMAVQTRMETNVAHTWQSKVTHGAMRTWWASLRSNLGSALTGQRSTFDGIRVSFASSFCSSCRGPEAVDPGRKSTARGGIRGQPSGKRGDCLELTKADLQPLSGLPSCRNSAFTSQAQGLHTSANLNPRPASLPVFNLEPHSRSIPLLRPPMTVLVPQKSSPLHPRHPPHR